MIETRAIVVRTGEGKVWVRLLENQSGCGRCDEPGGCHAPKLTEIFRGGGRIFTVDDSLGLCVDERVKVVIDEGLPLQAALGSYGLGTVLALSGAALGVWLAPTARADLAAATGLVLGIAATLFILTIRSRRGGSAKWRLRVERDNGAPPAGCMGTGV